mgnify:CR=1 FL=1
MEQPSLPRRADPRKSWRRCGLAQLSGAIPCPVLVNKVFVLHALQTEDLTALLAHALEDPRGFGYQTVHMPPDMLELIAAFANGDARSALSTLEMAVLNGDTQGSTVTVTMETLEQCLSKKSLL